jgi:hypothetical protein
MWVVGAKPTYELRGKLTNVPKWCGPKTIALIRDEDGGLSIIDHSLILKVDGKNFEVIEPKVNSWTVAGSKGSTYVVTETGGRYTCTCTGFQFRKSCKHLGMIK